MYLSYFSIGTIRNSNFPCKLVKKINNKAITSLMITIFFLQKANKSIVYDNCILLSEP